MKNRTKEVGVIATRRLSKNYKILPQAQQHVYVREVFQEKEKDVESRKIGRLSSNTAEEK